MSRARRFLGAARALLSHIEQESCPTPAVECIRQTLENTFRLGASAAEEVTAQSIRLTARAGHWLHNHLEAVKLRGDEPEEVQHFVALCEGHAAGLLLASLYDGPVDVTLARYCLHEAGCSTRPLRRLQAANPNLN